MTPTAGTGCTATPNATLVVGPNYVPPLLTAAEIARADLLRWRAEWIHQQRADASGNVPPGALRRARAEEARLKTAGSLRTATQGVSQITSSPVESSWTQIGPAPISFCCYGRNPAGRANDIATISASTWYMVTAAGGVWKTTNAGASWSPLTDQQASLASSSIAVDPSNASVLRVGTGEANQSVDSYGGAGILKSTDGGATWSQFGASTFLGAAIARVAVDPHSSSNARVLYAAATNANSGHGVTPNASTGLAKSSDSGQTWSYLSSLGSGAVSDVVVDPSGVVYAARYNDGIYRSTDGGNSFTKLTTGLPAASQVQRIRLAMTLASERAALAGNRCTCRVVPMGR